MLKHAFFFSTLFTHWNILNKSLQGFYDFVSHLFHRQLKNLLRRKSKNGFLFIGDSRRKTPLLEIQRSEILFSAQQVQGGYFQPSHIHSIFTCDNKGLQLNYFVVVGIKRFFNLQPPQPPATDINTHIMHCGA